MVNVCAATVVANLLAGWPLQAQGLFNFLQLEGQVFTYLVVASEEVERAVLLDGLDHEGQAVTHL